MASSLKQISTGTHVASSGHIILNPYSLRNVVSEKLQIPRAQTELFKKTFTYSGPKLWKNFRFRYGKHLLIMHLKQKLKVSC